MKNLKSQNLVPFERIENIILVIRDQKVIIDADLAVLYAVPTKRLNEAVKRNNQRFPHDFMFQLTKKEKDEVVANCDHLSHLKFSPVLPYVFTEHGALMAATVLNSPKAATITLLIIRTFVKLRQMLSENKDFKEQLNKLEEKYDKRFKVVFDALRVLVDPPEKPKKQPIGFNVK